MSHFFSVPVNENGIIADRFIVDDLAVATTDPLVFSDVYLYSHGWWTDATRAMQDYNRFTIEYARTVRGIAKELPPNQQPPAPLGVGVHWPSMLSENQGSLENWLQATSFYTMEKRADTVGEHAGYLLLRALFTADSPPKRLNLIGHSFGCKVILSALQQAALDKSTFKIPKDVAINVVLIQAALQNNSFDKDDIYAAVPGMSQNLRMLVTTSEEDKALGVAYPAAQAVNFFRSNKNRVALGFGGPNQTMEASLGEKVQINVEPGFDRKEVLSHAGERLIVADITGLHRDRANTYDADSFSGHHSDIFIKDLYELIAGFILGN